MTNPQIKYYPVGNGDTSLIILKDDTTILIDCNIRESAKGDKDKTMFDVKEDLLKSIKKNDDNNPFVDIFILTHGDQDHCRGFKNNFFQGDPKKYGKKNRDDNEIMIDELWFSPMIAEEHTNDDEDVIQTEAERRIKLHQEKDANRDLPGNRIIIVGYDGSKKYKDLDHLRKTPGQIVTKFNNKEQTLFSFFIHSPFKEQLKSAEKDKNNTSIVFQARFKNAGTDTTFTGLAMFGGDSDHYSWEVIYDKTKEKKNDVTHSALNWDLFLAPHHCSWSFFNDRPQEDNPTAQKKSLAVLDYKRDNALVIASSKEILNEKPNPPHYEAKTEYVKKVTKDKFINTETDEIIAKTPQPLLFEITAKGPLRKKEKEGTAKAIGSSTLASVNSTSGYGA